MEDIWYPLSTQEAQKPSLEREKEKESNREDSSLA